VIEVKKNLMTFPGGETPGSDALDVGEKGFDDRRVEVQVEQGHRCR